ncbi:AGAP011709-PA [Anopheles gambiae str. PEST]|uniref:AGAP011709-PA n=1 Tax=Anopheles gambiae TaxID=7165 RepID=A7UVH0_ANOGA|nr:AGAP011709-PA [Anopheles gambiae str. PEST]
MWPPSVSCGTRNALGRLFAHRRCTPASPFSMVYNDQREKESERLLVCAVNGKSEQYGHHK